MIFRSFEGAIQSIMSKLYGLNKVLHRTDTKNIVNIEKNCVQFVLLSKWLPFY